MQERKTKYFYFIFDVNERISLETIAFILPKNELLQIARLEWYEFCALYTDPKTHTQSHEYTCTWDGELQQIKGSLSNDKDDAEDDG